MSLHCWSLTLQPDLEFGEFLSSLCQQATHECPLFPLLHRVLPVSYEHRCVLGQPKGPCARLLQRRAGLPDPVGDLSRQGHQGHRRDFNTTMNVQEPAPALGVLTRYHEDIKGASGPLVQSAP